MSRPIVADPGWRLSDQDGYLVAIAGADEVWVVDDVPGSVAAELAGCWSDQPPTPEQLSAQALLAVDQLRPLGVFGAAGSPTGRIGIGLRWADEPLPELTGALADLCAEHGWPMPVELADDRGGGAGDHDGTGCDIEIVVRTSATMIDTAARAAVGLAADRLQLLCDLASARTIALGPLVVPGHTACIGCLAGRVSQRWGDPQPPARPGATGPVGVRVAAGLIMQQLTDAVSGRCRLIDATVALDLESLRSQRSPCLRSAACPHCAPIVTDGRVALPWAP